jgi:dethiobiotin synthetase
MPKGFFITGTDTGVGKTIITVALIKAVSLLGKRAGGMKPIETGCLKEGDIFVPSDGMFIKTMAHMEENIKHISPCCFQNPLAPLPASEREGVHVDLENIRRSYANLAKQYYAVIVEGIGGLLVPIKEDYFVLNLAKEFGLPLIIVASPGLGTINHTLLTVNYALKEGLPVAGIILNYNRPPEYSLAEETNPEVISKISPVPIIGIFPYLQDFESSTFEKAVAKHLSLDVIKRYL